MPEGAVSGSTVGNFRQRNSVIPVGWGHSLHFFSYSGLSVVLGEYEPYVKTVSHHFRGIGQAEGTDNHLLHLTLHAHATDDLHVLHPAQNLVLHLKAGLHAEARPLLDREGMLVQILESAGLAEVDDDV